MLRMFQNLHLPPCMILAKEFFLTAMALVESDRPNKKTMNYWKV